MAILIFAVGSGVSLYEGIEKLRHPHLSSNDVEAAITEIDGRLKQADSAVKRVFIEAQSWRAHNVSLRGG